MRTLVVAIERRMDGMVFYFQSLRDVTDDINLVPITYFVLSVQTASDFLHELQKQFFNCVAKISHKSICRYLMCARELTLVYSIARKSS